MKACHPAEAPAVDLAIAYSQRWEVESTFDEPGRGVRISGYSRYDTVVAPQSSLEVTQDGGRMFLFEGGSSLDDAAAEIAKMPPVAHALRAQGVPPREYVKFVGVLVQAYVVAASQAMGAQATAQEAQLGAALAAGLFGVNLAPENVQFVVANQAAVDRFMQTMQELSEP